MRRLLPLWLSACLVALAQPPAADFAGAWQGTLGMGQGSLRLVLNISRGSDGVLTGSLTSVDQGGVKLPLDGIEIKRNAIHLELKMVAGRYDGTLDPSGSSIQGTWVQAAAPVPQPLNFTRTAKAAAETTSATAVPKPHPLGLMLDVQVPAPPVPFVADGRQHLVYELHITNFDDEAMLLKRIEVLDGERPLAAFEGSELSGILDEVSASPEDNRTVDAGRRTVAFLWIDLPQGATPPARLRHRVFVGADSVESAAIPISRAKPPILGPPLRGSGWMAANGPGNASIHRRALIAVDGAAHIGQRFAIDWLKTGDDGRTFSGDAKDNKSYRAHGSEVLAVADAAVVAVKDGIPENVPGPNSRAVPITLDTVAGNHIILDLGTGFFAVYAHLQPGSLRVKAGDRVHQGQVLGLLGNSGNSTEPHLHFQICDRPSVLGSEGAPYLLTSFDILKTGAPPEARHAELPLQNVRVRFPDVR